jgi:autotransporter-associated beta strand protein
LIPLNSSPIPATIRFRKFLPFSMNTPRHSQARYAKYVVSFAALSLGFLSYQASAADVTWVGNTSNLWNVGTNWSTPAIPVNGSTLVFGAAGSSGLSISDNISSLTVGGSNLDGIVFGPAASGYTIARSASETLTLGSSGTGIGIKQNSFSAQIISAPLILGSTQTINVAEAPGALTLSGAISGSTFGITKTGAGLLTLSASNTFTGPVTLSAGTLATSNMAVGASSGLGTTAATVVFDGGTLRYAGATASTAKAFSINTGKTATVDVSVAANTLTLTGSAASTTGGLTKTGAGTLALSGANLYTGDTAVNQGTLALSFAGAGSDIVSSSSKLVLGGPATALHNAGNVNSGLSTSSLIVTGAASVTNTQSFNGVTLKQGNNAISATSGATGGSVTLALGAITANAGGVVNFTLPTSGAITTSTSNTNGILGGWATVGLTDWATNSAGTGVGNIAAYSGYTNVASGGTVANGASTNVQITTATAGSSAMAASGTTDINTLKLSGSTSYTLDIGTGNILRLGAQGGILFAGATAQTIGTAVATGGTLTAGGADNTDGQIVINAFNVPTINSAIKDNGTGRVSLVVNSNLRAGGEALLLNATTSNYSGGTYINAAKVSATNNTGFGTGAVNVGYSGAVILSGAGVYNNDFNVGGFGMGLSNVNGAIVFSAAATLGTNLKTLTLLNDTRISTNSAGIIAAKITGNYGLDIVNTNSSNVTAASLTLSNTANDFTGGLSINGGGVLVSTNPNTQTPITVKLGASEVISNGAGKGNVTILSGTTVGSGTLDLNSFNETINGLVSGTGTSLNGNGSSPQAFVTNNAAGTGTAKLTLGDGDATASFGGIIKDGTTAKVAIAKIGAGTQTFSGINTYTGGTTVQAGTLAFANTSFTMSGANEIAITAIGTAGTHYATVTTTSGTLTFGGTLGINITTALVGGETFYLFTTGTGGALAGDFGTTTGNVSLTGTYIASLANNGSGIWTGSSNGLDFTFSTSGINAGMLSVAVSAVPEPSTYAALVGALVLGVATIRRRRSQKSA